MVDDNSGDGYAGDVGVEQAFDTLTTDAGAVLVDVRTQAEWTFVGVPDLSGLSQDTVFVSWLESPSMERNPNFLAQLVDQGVGPENTILFICRSGQRSKSAAIAVAEAGYGQCFNVSGGFEGPLDSQGHRGGTDGWKAKNLPWIQK